MYFTGSKSGASKTSNSAILGPESPGVIPPLDPGATLFLPSLWYLLQELRKLTSFWNLCECCLRRLKCRGSKVLLRKSAPVAGADRAPIYPTCNFLGAIAAGTASRTYDPALYALPLPVRAPYGNVVGEHAEMHVNTLGFGRDGSMSMASTKMQEAEVPRMQQAPFVFILIMVAV